MEGGYGYVFQNRFKSTLIEDDGYLIKSIEYLLQNPVRMTMHGEILGSDRFFKLALKKFNRHRRPTGQGIGERRIYILNL